MASCFDRAHEAYEAGNKAEAHELSQEGKRHQALAERNNQDASNFIFTENNAVSRMPEDTIDLHGQYVSEAQQILQTRIQQARRENQDHLHVIVGKGNHSPGHIQKIKPMVEELCQKDGLQYVTEENEGRIFIRLTPGQPANMPPPGQVWGSRPPPGYGGQHGYSGQHGYPGQGQAQAGRPEQQFQQVPEERDDGGFCKCCIIM